jgi:hypothetical protein
MFRSSLTKPTENALAQVQWASRRDSAIDVPSEITPNAFEALAWKEQLAGRWGATIQAVDRWHDLEPFSVRPAVMGSFVAVAHLGDGAAGEAFSRRGLIANKGNSTLHNNLAVAYAIQGKLAEARAELEVVRVRHGTADEVVNSATRGMIALRGASIEEGVRHYRRAIELAIAIKDPVLWCRAAANFALEYARFDKSELEAFSSSIVKIYNRLPNQTRMTMSDVPTLLERAKGIQTVSDILERLSSFRERFLSYPLGDQSNG